MGAVPGLGQPSGWSRSCVSLGRAGLSGRCRRCQTPLQGGEAPGPQHRAQGEGGAIGEAVVPHVACMEVFIITCF